ncbi:allantoicase isoform X2 [Pygocentrus nattereri]|uniref:Allantoate amidinohydrolase n=1 Tax=Pygocentrus nattereri TaxID=42514 RepID=A0A3B4EEC1_PYGNA|nr:allantoicase isoform X2 [Pygocentrus nattereri]
MADRTAVKLNSSQPHFLQFNDLACEAVGGKVVFATDEWFAPAENLLKRGPPEFLASAFTEFGKWMDGWETRRKRIPDELSLPSLSLEGDRTGMAASESQFEAVSQLHSENWEELVSVTELKPGYADSCHNYFSVTFPHRVTHIRLNMYPDGGIARLRVYGVGQRDWSTASSQEKMDLVAMVNGGVCVGYSDAHFGHPRNMIGLGRADNMADGWETARRLDRPKVLKIDEKGILQVPGFEWAVFRLGHLGVISNVEIDTNHFKGNFPDSCKIEASCLTSKEEKTFISCKWNNSKGPRWRNLLPPQKLKPHYRHFYSRDSVLQCGPVTHVRLLIAPDGGVSRLRLWGHPVVNNSANLGQVSKL